MIGYGLQATTGLTSFTTEMCGCVVYRQHANAHRYVAVARRPDKVPGSYDGCGKLLRSTEDNGCRRQRDRNGSLCYGQ